MALDAVKLKSGLTSNLKSEDLKLGELNNYYDLITEDYDEQNLHLFESNVKDEVCVCVHCPAS